MPKGKSIYETYFEPGKTTGEYVSSLQKVSDVWTNIDFSREKSAWETERRERNLDTILAVTELSATIGGSMVGFEEGSAAISKKTGMEADSEPLKIGRGGEEWESLSGFEKLWQSPRFKFGDDTIMSKSEIRKYGRDVKEFGKYGVDLPIDVYQSKTMHEEYRQGYVRPEEDWYFGKYAKGALGVAEKVGQTIVPGGEVGYGDLYSGLGKKTAAIVQPTSKKKAVDPDDIHKEIREKHLAQFGGDRSKAMEFSESLEKHLGRKASGWQEELDWIEEHGQDPTKWAKLKTAKTKTTKLSFSPVPLEDLKKEQMKEFMSTHHPGRLYTSEQEKYRLYSNWYKGLSE